MKSKPATLNDIKGEGHAEIYKPSEGAKRCDGVFITRSKGALGSLTMSGMGHRGVYSGVVYDHGREHHLTFNVLVTDVHREGPDNIVARFSASGDPFVGAERW